MASTSTNRSTNPQIQVTEDLQTDVADHLVEEKWDDFGKLLKVPVNTRRRIQERTNDIQEKNIALLAAWHQRMANEATVTVS